MDKQFLAVQNGVILDVFDTREEALDRVKEEQQRDFVSIIIKRKLRKLFKKSGNVALHSYYILTVCDEEEIK